jgi:hypothetical protein
MGLVIGQSAAGDRIHLTARRGTDLDVTFEVRQSAGTAAACAVPVAGAPFVFADGVGLEAAGRAEGTNAAVSVFAEIRARGTTTTPGVMRLIVLEAELEKAFAAGAFRSIVANVNTVLNLRSTPFLAIEIDVENSAVTGA